MSTNETGETSLSAVDPRSHPPPPNSSNHFTTSTETGPIPGDDGLQPETRERASSVSDEYLRFLSRPGHIEKRFPVDRKKLERLIVAGHKDNETAEEFFKHVMDDTGTLILWPSKLKIGAKSKKDPQVKVVGLAPGVHQARELILADLDAKSSRVTLKIDVPFGEHSHVIGKEGANIKKVHEETNCHIHFPDTNRSFHGDKSNQVSITGHVMGVELARQRIRELLPVVVTLTLPLPGHIRVDPNSPDLQQMMLTYSVNIHIKPQPRQYSMLIVIRGTAKLVDGLKIAVTKVVEYFTGDYRYIPPVSLNLDIAPQHHKTLIGSGGGNIRKIMQETVTTIQFPDPQSRYHSNQVVVNGNIDNVLMAREQLHGCLPVVLMFDVYESEGSTFNSSQIGDLMLQLDVYISVKPKPKQPVQSVIIKSIEQNMQCMYQARMSLLECSTSLPVTRSLNTASPVEIGGVSPVPTDNISVITELPEEEMTVGGGTSPGNNPVLLEQVLPVPKGIQKSPSPEPSVQPQAISTIASPELVEPRKTKTVEIKEPPTDWREQGNEEDDKVREKSHSPPVPTAGGLKTAIPPRLTTRAFLDYDRKKDAARKAMKTKVEPDKERYPTTKWAGNFFSHSMPPAPDSPPSPPGPSTTPQGLTSINRTGFQALVRQASFERQRTLIAEQDTYRGISDIPTLLQRLGQGMEKYLSCFEEEEVDFSTFLTMTESDLKEIGVSTLGARRKLQMAIAELKKIHGKQLTGSASLPRGHYQNLSLGPRAPPPGLSKSQSLKHSSFSKSGRF